MFEIAIESSQKWNSEEAIDEIIQKVNITPDKVPTAVLLFGTIQYEKNNGFKKILTRLYEKIPKNTPLCGGSITGFMTRTGCYTRGIVLLAIFSDNVKVAVGVGRNTKKNPKKAANDCATMIKKNLETNSLPGKFIFENTSNGVVPKLPILGQKKVLKIPFSDLVMKAFDIFNSAFQYGVGREDEVLEAFAKNFSEYEILAAANYDDFKAFSNYQFCNNQIYTNSISALAINTPLKIETITTFGLTATNKKFLINKKSFHNCSFGKIDAMEATPGLFNTLGWSNDYLDEHIYRKTNYYPIGYYDNDKISAHVAGLFIGNHICYTYSFKKDELELFTTSGHALLQATKDNLQQIKQPKEKIKFAMLVECAIRLETLGKKSYSIYDELTKYFGEIPFLLVYGAGEGTYSPNSSPGYYNLSFNTTIFSE